MAIRGDVKSPLSVNVVYQIPGQFLDPEFEGVRTGRFSRKEALLLVQAALPRKVAPDPLSPVRHLLNEAIAAAEEFAQQEGMIDGELTELRKLAEQL
jgi:hypothetical protein